MKLITWNVNGIRARQTQVAELLATEQPDVVCLQEIKASPHQVPELMVSSAEYWSHWHGAGGYSGVAILVRRAHCPEPPAFSYPPFDMEQRALVASVGPIRVASVYVPNGGKDFEAKLGFLDRFAAWATEAVRGGPLVVAGDLNVAREDRDVHPKEQRPNQIGTRPEERRQLERLLAAGLVDVGRALDPENDTLFTWWPHWRNLRQRNIGWRIDYVLATAEVSTRALASESRRAFGTSDHAPVVVEFQGEV
jgi:exodeoxyribonuclease-3